MQQTSTYIQYVNFEEWLGYYYVPPVWLPSSMTGETLIGQIFGLILCSRIGFSNDKGNVKQKHLF